MHKFHTMLASVSASAPYVTLVVFLSFEVYQWFTVTQIS
jgi:hypothetical protein